MEGWKNGPAGAGRGGARQHCVTQPGTAVTSGAILCSEPRVVVQTGLRCPSSPW